MNYELKYNGKRIIEMTNDELKQQYKLNKKRIVGNSAFLAAIAGISLYYYLPATVVLLGIGVLRVYWISKNNKLIEKEANNRSMVLEKTKK